MYSLRDSIIKPEDLIRRLKEIGQDTVAITDHGSSLGGVSLYKALKAEGIRYLHGVEFYITEDATVKDKASRYHHLVALCKNETGRLNLNRLISLSEHSAHKYYKPRIDFSMLSEYGDGLIILSACLAGEICRQLAAGDYAGAKETALRYQRRFGADYYLEIQSHRDGEQIKINPQILRLSRETGIPLVVTCDAHYAWEKDRTYQSKYAFNGAYKEDGESYLDCFLQSEEEVRARLPGLPQEAIDEAIANTHAIAERCRVEMPLSPPIMPYIHTPPQYKDNYTWLEDLCRKGFRQKLNIDLDRASLQNPQGLQHTQEEINNYIARYEYERDSLTRMGFTDYILLVFSYANVAKRRGIARGSGGGSLICYLTNITNIDPVEHGLYFERFIDTGALDLLESGEITPSELKIPDIDLDFSADSCKEVLHFLFETYGEEYVASIGKFGTNQTKGTIRDLCKVLDIDLITADTIAKAFEVFEIDEIDRMMAGELERPGSAQDAIRVVKDYPELFDYVRKLNGLPKSFGLHACGKVISTQALDDFLPSCYDADGVRYLQGDMHDVEDVGLVKIDVLGLRTLDQQYDALELAGLSEAFISPKQDFADPKVLELFRTGDTLGVFQMSSYGMRQTLRKMEVSGIEDLSIANALYRPGAMSYIDEFCRRRIGKVTFEYLHPDLEPILRNTYGIIVFQEQLIEIGRLAGIRNPDLLRKATGKKNPKLLAQVKPELEEKLKARGWTDAQFGTLWADMLEFANYSFNKAHASAYGIIAYNTAKLKAYYPAEFYAGLCNSYIGKSAFVKEEAAEIMSDMLRHRVSLLLFDYREDHRRCSTSRGKLRYAIPLIRDCNVQDGEILYRHRGGAHSHLWRLLRDLNADGLGQAKLEILIHLGFFHRFCNSKQALRILDVLRLFRFGERRQMRKEQVHGGFLAKLLEACSTGVNAKGQPLKTYKDIQVPALLDAAEDTITRSDIPDFDYKNRAATQQQYLGFVSLVTGREEDRPKLFVKSVTPLHRKRDGRQFDYSVIAQSIGSGRETRYTVFNKVFHAEPIHSEDVILCTHYERDGKYFTLTGYEHLF